MVKKHGTTKRLLAIILSLTMMFALIPSNVFAATTIKKSGNFKYEVLANGTAQIIGYTGKSKTVKIPSKIGKYKVTRIGEHAISDNYKIKSVTIPNTVTNIGENAFSSTGIKTVKIPKSVKTIESFAFRDTQIKTVEIPKSVTTIGYGVFNDCNNLTSIKVATKNPNYSSANGVLFNKKKTKLIVYPMAKKVDTYTIPNSVKTIDEGAFLRCINIKHIIIPDSVTGICNNAFDLCSNLKTVKLSNRLAEISMESFSGCSSLKSISIPEGVKSIGDGAFLNCESLKSIELPNSLVRIGDSAFDGCTTLSTISIPNSVVYIGSNVFSGSGVMYNNDYMYQGGLYIGNRLLSVEPNYNNDEFEIKEDTKFIADSAISNMCSKRVSISENNQYFSVDENGVLFNKDKTELIRYPAFKEDTTYTIPSSVKTIGDYAFADCCSLTNVTISESVITIANGAFLGCSKLVGVSIPNSVTTIGEQAFENCKSLKNLVLPNRVKTIGKRAFASCENLKSVKIPTSIKSIGENAFALSRIGEIYLLGSKSYWNSAYKGIADMFPLTAEVHYSPDSRVHNNNSAKNRIAATYFAKGYSGDLYCNVCKTIVKKGSETHRVGLPKATAKYSAGKGKFKVIYKKVKGATGFQVQYKNAKKTVTKTFNTKESVTKVIDKLSKGTYNVKLRGFAKSGKQKLYSTWTNEMKVMVK